MMQRIIQKRVCTPLLVLLLCPWSMRPAAVSQSPASSKRKAVESKVGYVHLEELMGTDLKHGAQEWIDQLTSFQKELQAQYQKIAQDQERLKEIGSELQESAAKDKKSNKWMSEESLEKERNEKLKEATRLKSDIEFAAQAVQERQERGFQKLQFEYFSKVEKVAKAVGQEQGWDLILIGGAIHVIERVDVTADILEALNKEYSASKAPKKIAEKPAA